MVRYHARWVRTPRSDTILKLTVEMYLLEILGYAQPKMPERLLRVPYLAEGASHQTARQESVKRERLGLEKVPFNMVRYHARWVRTP